VFVLATMGTSGVDALLASIALAVLFVIYGVTPQVTTLWVPVLLVVLLMFTIGIGLFLASITVYLRDIRHALPLLLQVGLFITPVIYGLEKIPSQWRATYVFFNPVAMVIDGLRRTVLYGQAPEFQYLGIAALSSTIVLIGGFMLFKQLETGFADVS
jgi:lipopolysaccharide transport system permease protein